MRYRFHTCDVFTNERFGGNPLAVLPEASGLSDAQMQRIAREFNYSETTFVLPPESGHTRRVRIFTPHEEIPFAGHPNIGTAFTLASAGELGSLDAPVSVTFEEKAGLVPIHIDVAGGRPTLCELAAPAPLSLGEPVSVEGLAQAIGLSPDDIVTTTHPPLPASVGLEFVFAELTGADALERSAPGPKGIDVMEHQGIPFAATHLYHRADDGFDIHARVFVPFFEDPATGSANCALAALLAHCAEPASGEFAWRIAQGVEMGRPSVLEARSEKREGEVVSAWIGGASVMVSEGFIEVD
jgi:trans-2,3-dihydro-3-hydroxyanthranilate isomerase